MPLDVNFLTNADVALLKEMANQLRSGRFNTPSKSTAESAFALAEDYQAPETYIAKPPAGGIPAVTGTTPGFAMCEIYRVVNGNIVQLGGIVKKVHNITSNVITSDWVTVSRDKLGIWLVIIAIGGFESIRFTIITADCVAKSAVVRIDARPCGKLSVSGETDVGTGTGTDAYEQLTVYDPQGCFLDEPNADLINREGWAAYMVDDITRVCQWEIHSLCCSPDAC
jgi:hypothetical protein